MFLLPTDSKELHFPPVDLASPEGLLAIGGDLRCERLLMAYRQGIFPWYNEDQPVLWWSPDPRAVLFPDKFKISRSLRKTLRKQEFRLTMDTCFQEMIESCAAPRHRNATGGTWINPEMIEAYRRLHEQGYAHSVEAWFENQLVGGLYGVSLGRAFFGESMFSRVTDASKVALVCLLRQLQAWHFELIDAQVASMHMASLGAEEIRRRDFIALLEKSLAYPDRIGRWQFDAGLVVDPDNASNVTP